MDEASTLEIILIFSNQELTNSEFESIRMRLLTRKIISLEEKKTKEKIAK